MNPRIDLLLLQIHQVLGPFWLVVTFLLLAYVSFAKLHRALACVAIALILTQVWWSPGQIIALSFRWWLLAILGVRGLLHVASHRTSARDAVPKEPLLLAAFAMVSSRWAEYENLSTQAAASFALGMGIVFVVLWRLLDRIESLQGIFRPVLVFAFTAFALGFAVGWFADAAGDAFLLAKTGWGSRFSGIFYNPNMSGLLGAICLPVALAAPRAALGGAAWLRWPTVALICVAVFLSGSRSALVGSVLAVSLLGLRRFGIGALVVYGLLLALAFIVASQVPINRLEEGAVGRLVRVKSVRTLSGRTELWRQGWDAAQGHLALGNGWASSRTLEGIDEELAVGRGSIRGGTNLHNAHLQLLVDLGFVGLAIFWWFCLRVIGAGLRVVAAARDPRTTVPLLFFASAMALLADTFAHGGIFSVGSPSSLVFWCFSAVTLKEGARLRAQAAAGRALPVAGDAGARPDPALAPA